MPVLTGMQLVGTTLLQRMFLGEWSSMTQIIFGLMAMILLVTGVALTSLKAKNERQSDNPELKKAMGISVLLHRFCDVIVGFHCASLIYFGVGGTDALFFQSVGMAIGGFILSMNHKTSLKSNST